jgi:hypothetical protein
MSRPWRAVTKQLTCAQCGDVVADAAYRHWGAMLRVVPVEGARVRATSGAVQLQLAKERLASAAPGAAADEARMALARVERDLGEAMYEIECRQGHRALRTAPQIRAALRRAKGRWVSLA